VGSPLRNWGSGAPRHSLIVQLAEAANCTNCVLSSTRTQVVIGSGEITARVVIVGEAPGRNEDEGGAPFIGRSGQLLFRLLEEELGLVREDCYVTNVVKCRPPNNRTPKRAEIDACRRWWELQRGAMHPEVVLTLGLTATRAVLGVRSAMADLHGRISRIDHLSVVPTYHPAAALRQGPSVVDMMRADFRVARGLLTS